ncbi:MAG: hypothetical protein DMG78_23640 [Acidobacteria bacterium]|nr:MAG: hypothetical protein DMG78_23640 [Acidobacteriota bacterium]
MACARAFPISYPGSGVDHHVDRHRGSDRPVAQRDDIFDALGRSGTHFNLAQLGGLPEIRSDHDNQRLVTTGIRARVRHPVYLGHLCEMLAWSLGTGLLVCWLLTAFAIVTGAVMIRMEDAELEKRFGPEFMAYRREVPAILPIVRLG